MAFAATALGVTLGCNGTRISGATAEALTSNHAGAPILVGCEPHQRTLVRQAIVNGAAVSQVECVAGAPPAQAIPASAPMAAAPAAYVRPAVHRPAPGVYVPAPAVYVPPPAAQPAHQPVVHDDLDDVPVVRTTGGSAGPVRTGQVIYDDPPAAPTRSPAKSAVIIGSSAGAGAGVGAAVGGRKGALIGAAVGGGGAAVWDQVTRRK